MATNRTPAHLMPLINWNECHFDFLQRLPFSFYNILLHKDCRQQAKGGKNCVQNLGPQRVQQIQKQ